MNNIIYNVHFNHTGAGYINKRLQNMKIIGIAAATYYSSSFFRVCKGSKDDKSAPDSEEDTCFLLTYGNPTIMFVEPVNIGPDFWVVSYAAQATEQVITFIVSRS